MLQGDGLPFTDVLNQQEIQDTADRHGIAFAQEEDGIYTSAITLWASLSQVLHEGKQRSCLAAVSRVMVLLVALGREPGKKHSGPYCRARAKLSEAFLDDLTLQVAHGCEKKFQPRDLWCNRPVKLADGTNWGFAIWDFKISY